MTKQKKRRPWLLITGAVLAIAFWFIACLIFLPFTYVVSESKAPVTWKGQPVIRHGYSHIHQKIFGSGRDYDREIIEGRCFIDVNDNGHERRIYGWRLQRKVTRNVDPAKRVRSLEIH